MKKILCLVLALAMVFSLVACGSDSTTTDDTAAAGDTASESTAEGAEVLKIGGVGPLTGAAAQYGNAVKNGAEIAVEEINALGGLQIELNFQDDEGDSEKSINAYNNLKDWGMQLLFGPVTTNPAIAVASEAQNDGYFMLTGTASSESVIETGDKIFRLCFADPEQGVAIADYIAENMADATIGVLYDSSDAYSSGIREAFETEAAAKGLNVVDTEAFTADNKSDFTTQLQLFQSNGVDLLVCPFYYSEISLVMTQADKMGYDLTFFGADGMDGILTVPDFDATLAEGAYLMTPFSASSADEATQSFTAKYQEKYGETPSQFAADGYDCIYAIYQAAVDGGFTSDMTYDQVAELMVSQFTSMTVTGLTGEMTWLESGAVSKLPQAYVITDGVYAAA